ncbi:Uncharacterised protein [Mycobacteroides abscessus subsp. abscessus]|nr:Uncharacterised protein [Mycobacteroides abscessus subsp. abscessus]
MHDVDARRIRVVYRNQLVGFIFGVNDEPVGLVDHLLLAHATQRGLGAVTLGEGLVLDGGECVRGVHQRDTPAVTGEPARLTREPIVRVNQVVVARFVDRFGPQYPGGKGAQLGGQVVLVQPLEGTRDDIAHRHPVGDGDHGLVGRRGGTGENVDGDTPAGQLKGSLQHVDVHPAGIAGARLSQWRGVYGQDGDAARLQCRNRPARELIATKHTAILSLAYGLSTRSTATSALGLSVTRSPGGAPPRGSCAASRPNA